MRWTGKKPETRGEDKHDLGPGSMRREEKEICRDAYSWPAAPRNTGSAGRRNWKLPWASVSHCCGRYCLTCREPTRMSLSTSCIPCEGGLGGVLDGGRGRVRELWRNPGRDRLGNQEWKGVLGWKGERLWGGRREFVVGREDNGLTVWVIWLLSQVLPRGALSRPPCSNTSLLHQWEPRALPTECLPLWGTSGCKDLPSSLSLWASCPSVLLLSSSFFSLQASSSLHVSLPICWCPRPWALAHLFLHLAGNQGYTVAASFGLSQCHLRAQLHDPDCHHALWGQHPGEELTGQDEEGAPSFSSILF